ncbi:response regulator transcription factor [Thermosynechococcaceae cyanobacterium Okahandja]
MESIAAPSRLLLVCTDPSLSQRLGQDLQAAGYDPVIATSETECHLACHEWHPALIIMDRYVDGLSNLALCQRLREAEVSVPIVLLMESDRLEDRIAVLEAGADDYLLLPYTPKAFLQMIQLYLKPPVAQGEVLRFDNLSLDLLTRRAERNGRTIDLTMKEYELLKFLMEHPREVLSREQILENVWGYDFLGESNVIEVYIRYLRLKIEPDGEKRLIHTVRGVGYVLREA